MVTLQPTSVYTLADGTELRFFAKNAQKQYLRPDEQGQWVTAIVEHWKEGQLQMTNLIIRDPATISQEA